MTGWFLREMEEADMEFVSTCSHGRESEEIIACGADRRAWLESMVPHGLRVLVAIDQGFPVGFLYVMPVEISPRGPRGEDLMIVPCLYVLKRLSGQGIGKGLLSEAEGIARSRAVGGLAVMACDWDFWFMPASFFLSLGYTEADRQGKDVILWKHWREIPSPHLFVPNIPYRPTPGAVTIDLCWNTFCQTSWIEAQHVREVAAEFGDKVVLHEFSADDPTNRAHLQCSRAIFIDGREMGWGYEAPREGLREAIEEALPRSGFTAGRKEEERT
jgi:GNAT superfamily N-acetyltransferase